MAPPPRDPSEDVDNDDELELDDPVDPLDLSTSLLMVAGPPTPPGASRIPPLAAPPPPALTGGDEDAVEDDDAEDDQEPAERAVGMTMVPMAVDPDGAEIDEEPELSAHADLDLGESIGEDLEALDEHDDPSEEDDEIAVTVVAPADTALGAPPEPEPPEAAPPPPPTPPAGAQPTPPPKKKRKGLGIALGCVGVMVALLLIGGVGIVGVAVVGGAAAFTLLGSDVPPFPDGPPPVVVEAGDGIADEEPVLAPADDLGAADTDEAAEDTGAPDTDLGADTDDLVVDDQAVEDESAGGTADAPTPRRSSGGSTASTSGRPSTSGSGTPDTAPERTTAPATTRETEDAPTPGGADSGSSRSPSSPPPGMAKVTFSGAEAAFLVRGGERIKLPANVWPNRYDLVVTFPGEPEIELSKVRVKRDEQISIRCKAAMGICKVQ